MQSNFWWHPIAPIHITAEKRTEEANLKPCWIIAYKERIKIKNATIEDLSYEDKSGALSRSVGTPVAYECRNQHSH